MKQLPKIHESRLVEPRYKIEQMDLEFANGERRTYERIHGSGRPVVVIVPMLDADTVLLGVGTLANAIVIGLAVDASLVWLPAVDDWAPRIALMLAGVVLNGVAGAVYIGAQLGRGPRDGLMTGLARRTGRSLRLVRSLIEVVVLVIGLALGGTAGLGTLVFALAIGPLTQFFLTWTLVRQPEPVAG